MSKCSGFSSSRLLRLASFFNFGEYWNQAQKQLLLKQIDSLTEIPEVIGSYYVTRSMNNAFRNAVYNGDNYREALMEQVARANEELIRKQKEIDKKAERRERT